MRFDAVIPDALLTTALVLTGHVLLIAQKKPQSVEMPEMLATEQITVM